jgi:hypothetical protein
MDLTMTDYEAKARDLLRQLPGSHDDHDVQMIASALSLAAKQEREACAKIADELVEINKKSSRDRSASVEGRSIAANCSEISRYIVKSIRARDDLCQASSSASGQASSREGALQSGDELAAHAADNIVHKLGFAVPKGYRAEFRQMIAEGIKHYVIDVNSQIEERGTRDDATAQQEKPA